MLRILYFHKDIHFAHTTQKNDSKSLVRKAVFLWNTIESTYYF